MNAPKMGKMWWRGRVCIAIGFVLMSIVGYVAMYHRQIQNNVIVNFNSDEYFPNVIGTELSPTQLKIVDILRDEYNRQPSGTKYSEGANEPWCANFVSWVRKEAGMPLENPVTGRWRIPGTKTLLDSFVASGKWRSYGDGYIPKTGDVAIYDGLGPHGQHANFVIKYVGGTLTTVGGNEAGSIHRQDHQLNDQLGLVGFGVL